MLEGIGYTRVSTDEQGESRKGLDAQERAIICFAEANNIVLLDVREEIESGAVGLDGRPVLKSCIDDAKGRALLVAKLDRFSRDAEFIAVHMNSLVRQKVRLVPCDLGMDVEPFQMHIYAALAQKEREMIGQRTKAALDAIKASGRKLGIHTHKTKAKAHSGLVHGREAQARKALAFADTMRPLIEPMRLQGMTYEAIAERLNAYQTPTARGGKWSIVSVRNLVLRWD